MLNKAIIDLDTGELEYLDTEEYSKFKSKQGILKVINNTAYKDRNLFKTFIDEKFGSFYFNFYEEIINKDYLFRFIYLCSYMNFKGYLMFGDCKCEGKLINKKDLFTILAPLSQRECYNTINYLTCNNFLNIDKYGIKVNEKYCKRGKIKHGEGAVRMFDRTIQKLYEKTKPMEHKKIDLLIKILPMIHYDYNIISYNPNEEFKQNINPYTLTELAKELNYSTSQKLKKALFELRVDDEKVIMISKFDNIDMLVVNPKVYYKGNKLDKLQGIITLFDIAKKY